TLEQYWETKQKIFQNQSEDDWAVYNCDDPRVRSLALSSSPDVPVAQGVWTTGQNLTAASDPELDVFWVDDVLTLRLAGEGIPVIAHDQVPLHGGHNRANLSAALGAVAAAIGPEVLRSRVTAIADAIRNFQALPHRLEIVARAGGITWVNDSQSTIPDATI